MGTLDVEHLLEPISPELPCGEDLEYDQEFGEMERAAQPVSEQQFGETVIEGEEADWKEVRGKALSLFARTRDLRVGVTLARSALRTSGLPEFCETVSLIRGLADRFWEDVHPRLDPDDDNDPTLRVNTLATLFDEQACLRPLRAATLLEIAALGRFTYLDHLIASGEMEPLGDEPAVETSMIDAILENIDLEELRQRADILRQAVEDIEALESSLTERVGVSNAASFEPLAGQLRKMSRVLQERLERRGGAVEEEQQDTDQEAEQAGGETKPAALDEIRSREDVNRLLDKICEYYKKNEPASPVPLLLQRAKRVAGLGFMELLRELAPGGVSEAETVTGVSDGSDNDD